MACANILAFSLFALVAPAMMPLLIAHRATGEWRRGFFDDFRHGLASSRWGRYSGGPRGDPGGGWAPSHAVVAHGILNLETYEWPPEIDFAENGGETDRRDAVSATLHYGSANNQIQRTLHANSTRWHEAQARTCGHRYAPCPDTSTRVWSTSKWIGSPRMRTAGHRADKSSPCTPAALPSRSGIPHKSRMRIVGGALVLGALLAGCGGGHRPGASASTAARRSLSTPSATTGSTSPGLPSTSAYWPYAKMARRLTGRSLALPGGSVRLDGALLECNGEGPAVRRGATRDWRRYICTQTVVQRGVDRDVTFDVVILSDTQLRIVSPRYGSE